MNILRETIRLHPFFSGMEPAHLDILAHHARKENFKAGEMLFREGEPANRFFLISKGKIALEAHDPADGTARKRKIHGGVRTPLVAEIVNKQTSEVSKTSEVSI